MISIAMATYNGEKYLREQIDSILNQTIQDFELIVCDDCSTDTTWNILLDYQVQDKRIKCYRNEENLGFKKNFEKAIRLCTGEYIALSDQDDIWLPEHLEKLINIIGNADLACGTELLFSDTTNKMREKLTLKEEDMKFTFPSIDFLYVILCHGNFLAGNSMLFSRSFFQKIVPFPDVYHDFWLMSCSCVCNGFVFYPIPITRRRVHLNNVSGISLEEPRIFSRILSRFFSISEREKSKIEYKNRLSILQSLTDRFNLAVFFPKDVVAIRRILEGKLAPRLSVKRFIGLYYYMQKIEIISMNSKVNRVKKAVSFIL